MDNQIVTRRAVVQVLRDYLTQYRRRPVMAFVAFLSPAIGEVLVGFVPPLVIAQIVNIIAAGHTVSIASLSGYIALFSGVWVLGEALWRIGIHLIIKIESEGIKQLGNEAFRRLTERDYNFYANNFVGSLTKRATSFSRGFETFTDTLVFNVVTNVLPIVFAVVVLWRYSPWIPALLIASIAIAVVVGLPIIRRRSKLVAARHDAGSRISGRISDALTNILAVKSFGSEEREREQFAELSDDYSRKYKIAYNYQNLRFDMFMAPLYVVANLIGLVAAIFFTQTLGLQAGALVVIFTYYAHVTLVFWNINRVYRNLESALNEAAEFTQLTIDPPMVRDVPNAHKLQTTAGRIDFTDVGFGYGAQNDTPFLDRFNLTIPANQKVGLVGPSGGGKTTITKLLLRFIDLRSGSIAVDGQDIGRVTQTSLRQAIAYVPQDPLLFHRSLSENIAYGRNDATREQIIEAAKLARAHEFIEKLPKGYDTLVGERGVKLSGGQRQRVAIARAILKQAPILVLDEATSSLDSESEKYIQEGLRELMKGKTAIVIAHRLSTIKHLDRIIVLDRGKIVEDGTHEELIARRGLYARLWGHQSGEFLAEA